MRLRNPEYRLYRARLDCVPSRSVKEAGGGWRKRYHDCIEHATGEHGKRTWSCCWSWFKGILAGIRGPFRHGNYIGRGELSGLQTRDCLLITVVGCFQRIQHLAYPPIAEICKIRQPRETDFAKCTLQGYFRRNHGPGCFRAVLSTVLYG
jgi:hypothetical protein